MDDEKLRELNVKAQDLRNELAKVESDIESIEHSKTSRMFSHYHNVYTLSQFLHQHYKDFENKVSSNWHVVLHGDLIGLAKSAQEFWDYLFENGIVDKEYIPMADKQAFINAVYMIADEIHQRPYNSLRKNPLYVHD